MSTPPTGLEAEEYIKSQIELGVASRDILSTLLQVDVPSTYGEISQLEEFRALDLSDEFISSWLFYPSGRAIPSQVFVNYMRPPDPNVPILTRDNNGYFIQKEDGIMRMPCLGAVNEFFYVPLTGDDVLLSTCSSYEYEPDSLSLYSSQDDTIKHSHVLFAPDYDMAIYYFATEETDFNLDLDDLTFASEILMTGYPGILTEDILETLQTRYQDIQEGIRPCEPTLNPLIPPQVGRYMVCNAMRGYELVVVGDEFIAPYRDHWVTQPGTPHFSPKGINVTNEQKARVFVHKKGFASIEDYLEYLFNLGVHPRVALSDLMSDVSEGNISKYGNWESPARDHDHVKIKNSFNLSPEFMLKWLIYPSGRVFGRFKYLDDVDVPTVNLSTVRHLIPLPNILTRPGFLVEPVSFENPVITPLPCTFFDNQPLYIPVLRYERKTAYSDEAYCGTYYYFDDGPQLYLKSNKTLIAPNFGHAYFYLKGENLDGVGNRREQRKRHPELSDQEFDDMFKTLVLEDIRHEAQHCERSDYRDVIQEGGTFEKDLCRLARSQGYDVIISIYPFQRRTNVSEIMDTRPRSVAYGYLHWAV